MATTNTPQKTKNKVSEGVQPTPVDKFNFNLPGTPGYIKPSDTSTTTTTTTIITTTQKNPVAPPINTNNANITRDAASNKKVPRPNQAKKSMNKKKIVPASQVNKVKTGKHKGHSSKRERESENKLDDTPIKTHNIFFFGAIMLNFILVIICLSFINSTNNATKELLSALLQNDNTSNRSFSFICPGNKSLQSIHSDGTFICNDEVHALDGTATSSTIVYNNIYHNNTSQSSTNSGGSDDVSLQKCPNTNYYMTGFFTNNYTIQCSKLEIPEVLESFPNMTVSVCPSNKYMKGVFVENSSVYCETLPTAEESFPNMIVSVCPSNKYMKGVFVENSSVYCETLPVAEKGDKGDKGDTGDTGKLTTSIIISIYI